MRAALVRLHRWLGLALAAFLLVAGLTGSVIAFQRELDAALNPQLFTRVAGGPALGFDALARRVEAQLPGARVGAIQPPAGFVRSALVRVDAAEGHPPLAYDEVFADPATGRVLGTRLWGEWAPSRENLVPFLFKLHYSLHLPGQWGAWLMGGVALAWVLDCLIALAVTAPRGGRRLEGWRRAASIKRGAGPQRRTFDLHRAPGLWLWGVLLLLAISGVALNLKEEVFRPVVSLFSPVAPPVFKVPVPELDRAPALGFDAAARVAERQAQAAGVAGSAAYVVHAPALNAYGVAIAEPGQRDPRAGIGPAWFFVDDRDGSLRSVEIPGRGSAGDLVMQLQYPIHTGLLAGLAGRILVCLTGLAVALLSVTGVLIWRLKRRGRRLAGVPAAGLQPNSRSANCRSASSSAP